jgi:micrococcal nuclease
MIIGVGLAACTGAETMVLTTPGTAAHVVNVPDGDSLIVDMDGIEEKVRLIGINAPEHDECFGEESATGLRDLLADADITVATDIEPRDQYGRLLAYVYRDGVLINEEVAFRGLVLARAYEPNTTYQEQIDGAAEKAQQSLSGMWAPTACASASGASVVILEIEANPPGPDEDNLNGEWVVVANTGDTPIDLTDWSLRDASSVHRYSFSTDTILGAGKDLFIFTGCGSDDADNRYWCADGPVWGNSGDSAFLLDADGRMAATFDY